MTANRKPMMMQTLTMGCRGEKRNERVCHSTCGRGNSDHRFVSDYFSEDMNNAQIQIPISRHACLLDGGFHTCPANAVSGVPDLAGGGGVVNTIITIIAVAVGMYVYRLDISNLERVLIIVVAGFILAFISEKDK